MTRAEIRDHIRAYLGDEIGYKWQNSALNTLINVALQKFCYETSVCKAKITMQVTAGQSRYRLPQKVLWVKRVELNGREIPRIRGSDLAERCQ